MINWPSTLNTRFYAFSKKPVDNSIISEMESGRKVGYLKNTKNLFTISVSIDFTPEEETAFYNWYFNDLGGLTGVFYCPALSSKRLRFADIPEPKDTDQALKSINFNLEEV